MLHREPSRIRQAVFIFVAVLALVLVPETRGDKNKILSKCDFEKDICGWKSTSGPGNVLKWRRSDQVDTSLGKSIATTYSQSGSDINTGFFAALEVANGKTPNKDSQGRLRLDLPRISKPSPTTIEFRYASVADKGKKASISVILHVKGEREDCIRVIKQDTKGQWKNFKIDICAVPYTEIVIEGKTFSKDAVVAIDDVKITQRPGRCSANMRTSDVPPATSSPGGSGGSGTNNNNDDDDDDDDCQTEILLSVFLTLLVVLLTLLLIWLIYMQLKKKKADPEKIPINESVSPAPPANESG